MNWRVHVQLLAASLTCACSWPEPQVVDHQLGVDAKLTGVSGPWFISEDGLVVTLSGQQVDLGDHALRGVDSLLPGPSNITVVGDDGYVAFGVGHNLEDMIWYELDPGTDADLRAVVMIDANPAELLIVGDEILLRATEVGPGEFTWVEPLPPPSGWGSLRDATFDAAHPYREPQQPDQALIVVGDDGRLLTSDITGLDWTLRPLDTDADLHCAGALNLYGARGTWVFRENGEWTVSQLDPTVDYIAYGAGGLLIDSERRVHDRLNEVSVQLDWQPLAVDQEWMVGAGGRVGQYVYGDDCNICDLGLPFSAR